MYIRLTKTSKSADGKPYYSYRLVCSKREGNKVKQVTLLNLGRNFCIPRQDWKVLCSRIEEIITGQQLLFHPEHSPEVEEEAQRIAQQLLVKKDKVFPSIKEKDSATEFHEVDVNSLEMIRPRTIGIEHVALWAMNHVEFFDILKELGFSRPQRAAAAGMITARMAGKGSESSSHRWLGKQSGFGELIEQDFEKMSIMQFYRTSDLLLRHKKKIEAMIFDKVCSIFGFSCTVTLYDLTNTYFEGDAKKNKKACRGYSKDKRFDRPLVTLGLVLDGSGFVRSSSIFSGNVSEPGTMKQVLIKLGAPKKALVVMDRGIATQENISWLRENRYKYIVVNRERQRSFDTDKAVCIETASRQKVHIYREIAEDESEVRLYCYSEKRAGKEKGIVERFTREFEEGLRQIVEGLSRPRGTKRLDKVYERIGRLKEKCQGVSRHYRIKVIPDETGKKAKAIEWEKFPRDGSMLSHPGVYCLRSNLFDWDEKKLWSTYIMLTDLENVFRSLKSELGMRPVYHQKEERCDGHLFITVLAYQFVHIIRNTLRAKGITKSWESLRETLSTQLRVTATFQRSDGRTLNVRKPTLPEVELKEIYNALNLYMNPGGVKKLVV